MGSNNLNLGNLKLHKDDVLKTEIGALLFNLGKTHIGISNWRKYFPSTTQLFSSYKDYYKNGHFENELAGVDFRLKDFIFNEKVKLPDNSDNVDWKEFFYGDSSNDDFIKKIFFRGCENINSGIDKGSPQDSNQLETLWISNAFGSVIRGEIKEDDFDKSRLCFFQKFHRFLEDKKYYNSPDWIEIRNFIFPEIKSWYSMLLSDSRFPVNDVTLWDQAYMTASMFKATLAGLYLDNSKQQDFINNPQKIKWSILGIQYDKLGLAEKGLKAASINWYREKSKEVDKKIKELIEIEYPLGNEVYRDETGIYFVVAENIIGENEGDFYKLHSDLSSIKSEIQKIFTDEFGGEIYPTIFLTEPSRGLMNLGHLIERAKENFLKAELPAKFEENLKSQFDDNPSGICQICKMRLANNGGTDNLICDVCSNRADGRVKEWLNNSNAETIWLDELQDKNGRVALVTLKFELDKWINGDLVNSFVVKSEEYDVFLLSFIAIISNISNTKNLEDLDTFYDRSYNKIEVFISLFDKNGIQKPFESLLKEKILKKILCQPQSNLADREIGLKDLFFRSLNVGLIVLSKQVSNWIEYIQDKFSNDPKFNFVENRFKNQAIFNNSSFSNFIKSSFVFGFIILQIYQLIFERSIGSKWEEFIKNSLSNSSAINFDNREIDWGKLNNNDIEFLSQLLFQFLLRKNPSPARLRRVWETTQEFFKYLDLGSRILKLAEIPEERQKRLVWKNVDIEDGEYQDSDILFWAKDNNVYLISSVDKIYNREEFNLKKYGDNGSAIKTLKKDKANEQSYRPYFSILSPTPVSWQFIIPAEYVPNLIKNIQEEYYKNFKWVYGKLPLHIGVIIQNYKRPLYVGIKALRKIRRDKQNWVDLRIKLPAKDFKARQKTAFYYQQNPEHVANCENFYSLFERADNVDKKYEFYLYPNNGTKVWIDTTQNATDTDKFYFYPNTFDFEFLDTNVRRNDIYYEKSKRLIKYKQMRPYDLHGWQYFEEFEKYFSEKKSSSKLQKLISLIYSKLEDWGDGNLEALKQFMISAFVNILELKDKDKNEFAAILEVNSFEELKNIKGNNFRDKLFMLIDMFEFWHTSLKFENFKEE